VARVWALADDWALMGHADRSIWPRCGWPERHVILGVPVTFDGGDEAVWVDEAHEK
jgi:hypothetical protein